MKIAMLTSDYLPNIGGIASHIYELSKALIDNGQEVEVWVWNRKGLLLDKAEMGDIPVKILPVQAEGAKRGRRIAKSLTKAIEQCLQEFDADILHLHTLDPLLLSLRYLPKEFKGKCVWTNHSSRFLRKVDSPFWRLSMRFYGRALDGLLAPSQELLDKSRCMGVPEIKCEYIANGVDVEKFKITDKRQARNYLGLPSERFILLSTRRFSPKNGIRFLAMALPHIVEKIPHVLCVFCGNMPDAKDLPVVMKIVEENHLQEFVRFEGSIPNAEINKYLSAADIVVLPSLMEATSISGLEAMAAGRPLVGTRIGGIPELIVEGKTGCLVNAADPQSLAHGVIRAYTEFDLTEMGMQARERVLEGYTWSKIAQKVSSFYQRLLD